LLVAIPLLALVGVVAFVGYSYWEYRTFWGDPNVPPSDVTSLGAVETKTFYSEALGRTMEYNIYLPPGYGYLRQRFTTYPVVYLLHGRPGADNDWVSKGGAAEAMDTLFYVGEARRNSLRRTKNSPTSWRPAELPTISRSIRGHILGTFGEDICQTS
jgi:hypothetical protein